MLKDKLEHLREKNLARGALMAIRPACESSGLGSTTAVVASTFGTRCMGRHLGAQKWWKASKIEMQIELPGKIVCVLDLS